MNALFLLPLAISAFLVFRGRIVSAFLSVYLPVLLLLPEGYLIRLPHLPPISATEGALIPLGIIALPRLLRQKQFCFMDGLVLLFFLSYSASEILREPVLNNGIFLTIGFLWSSFFAYAVGRTLIEPDLRFPTAKRIVALILISGAVGVYQWRVGDSFYATLAEKLSLPVQLMATQFRWGHGRMTGAFGDAEIAGIIFGMAFALSAWLQQMRKKNPQLRLGKTLEWMYKRHLPALLLLFFTVMTGSRGPLAGLAAGIVILQILRFKNTRRASLAAACLLALMAAGAYEYYTRYTNVSFAGIQNEQQSSALYRRKMNVIYQPVADAGGLLGWGALNIPVLEGMRSIDNAYLLVRLRQGRIGYIIFLLITFESVRVLAVRSWRFPAWEDRAMALTLLAAMAVMWLTLTTVYMGEQLPQLAFLLFGWAQSLSPTASKLIPAPDTTVRSSLQFKRVFE